MNTVTLGISFKEYSSIEEMDAADRMLVEEAIEAQKGSYAPYSNFLVGCAVLLENGEIHTGSNQENAAFPSGLCAERTAIFWISANFPDVRVKKIFVVGGPRIAQEANPPIPPCGGCRQSLMEYETKQQENIELYFASMNDEVYKVDAIKDLLPFYFDGTFL